MLHSICLHRRNENFQFFTWTNQITVFLETQDTSVSEGPFPSLHASWFCTELSSGPLHGLKTSANSYLESFILDEFLDSVNNVDKAIFIVVAHIAGVEPPVRVDSRCRRLGVVEISGHQLTMAIQNQVRNCACAKQGVEKPKYNFLTFVLYIPSHFHPSPLSFSSTCPSLLSPCSLPSLSSLSFSLHPSLLASLSSSDLGSSNKQFSFLPLF